jgi:hypothetical protein
MLPPSLNRACCKKSTRRERVYFCLENAMPITAQQLLQILPNAGKQAGVFASALCS